MSSIDLTAWRRNLPSASNDDSPKPGAVMKVGRDETEFYTPDQVAYLLDQIEELQTELAAARKETEEAQEQAQEVDAERLEAIEERDEALRRVGSLEDQLESMEGDRDDVPVLLPDGGAGS